MTTIKNCVLSWLCGWGLGIWLGFYDYAGTIYYSVGDGIRAGAFLAAIFAIISLWENLIGKRN